MSIVVGKNARGLRDFSRAVMILFLNHAVCQDKELSRSKSSEKADLESLEFPKIRPLTLRLLAEFPEVLTVSNMTAIGESVEQGEHFGLFL